MTIRKIIGKIHLWLGLTSGLVVFIVALTGSLYVFIDELRPIVYSDRLEIKASEIGKDRLPMSEIIKIASRELTLEPLYMEIPNKPNATIEVQTWGHDPKAWSYLGEFPNWETIYINPYTGDIVQHVNTATEFFALVMAIHLTLLLNSEIGSMAVGVSTLIFVIMLLTGMFLWWPKNKWAAKQKLWFQWKSNTKWRRKNYDLHNIVGFYSMAITLLIALTGLIWAFEWVNQGVQWVANGGQTITENSGKTRWSNFSSLPQDGHDTDSLFDFMCENYPEAKVYTMGFDDDTGFARYIDARLHDHRRYETVSFLIDSNGKMVPEPFNENKTTGKKLYALNYDIHTGSIIGISGKIIAFLASLAAASLPITGVLFWYGRHKKKKRRVRRKKPLELKNTIP